MSPIALQWRPDLREQLLEMRTDLLGRMQRRGSIEPGVLPLIAGIAAALEVVDQSAEAAAPAAVDGSGVEIRLIMYRDGTAIAAAELAPTAAIQLAGELLGAAGIRLTDDLAELRQKSCR